MTFFQIVFNLVQKIKKVKKKLSPYFSQFRPFYFIFMYSHSVPKPRTSTTSNSNSKPAQNITKHYRSPTGETILVDLRHENFSSRKTSDPGSRRNSGSYPSQVSLKRRVSTTNHLSYKQIPAESLETLKFLDTLQNYNKNYNDYKQVYYSKMPNSDGTGTDKNNGRNTRASEIVPVCDPPPDFLDSTKGELAPVKKGGEGGDELVGGGVKKYFF